jgi:hypothetical protein
MSEVTTLQLARELYGNGDGNVELQRCKLALLQHCKLATLQLASRQCCGVVAARVATTLLQLASLQHCCNRRCGNVAALL